MIIPDVTFELAKKNADMYLFSPYDVERVEGKPFEIGRASCRERV